MKHKHSELIKAWADGAEIEQWESNRNTRWTDDPNPTWYADKYRIKPEPETITETLWVCIRTVNERDYNCYNDVSGVGVWADDSVNSMFGFIKTDFTRTACKYK
jgi:hypothetical protein